MMITDCGLRMTNEFGSGSESESGKGNRKGNRKLQTANRQTSLLYSKQLINFYLSLQAPRVPRGFAVLHPHPDKEVVSVVKQFFEKFYHDNHPRKLMLGINPGRFGAGITGINFTAPRQLKENCGIDHPWKNSSELSAEFIYKMIDAYGGPRKFYHDYFIGAVSPLGYTQEGININYYDDKKLAAAVRPFVVDTLKQQLKMGFSREVCFCIGGEKNFKYLDALNKEHHFFEKIIPLPHPRFIMQYKRKQLGEYVNYYLEQLVNS